MLNPDAPRTCAHDFCGPGPCEGDFDHWTFDVTCPACPLQIEGSAHGMAYYFRARHDRWRLELGERVIASGDTDDFTIPQAVDLIMRTINDWIYPR